jgi:hypothetical protein
MYEIQEDIFALNCLFQNRMFDLDELHYMRDYLESLAHTQ